MMTRALFAIACLLSTCLASSAHAATDEPVSGQEIVKRMLAERERLVRGTYAAEGTYEEVILAEPSIENADEIRSDAVQVSGAFDFAISSIRTDRLMPTRVFSSRLKPYLRRGEEVPETVFIVSAKTHEYSFHYLDVLKSLEVHAPNVASPPGRRVNGRPNGSWIDVRAMGICNDDELFRGWTLEEIFAERLEKYDLEVTGSENGIYELTFMLRDTQKRKYWIDSNQGYTVTKFVAMRGGPKFGKEE